MRERMLAEIERAATVGEPAHDELVAADDLLSIDAEVLPFLVRAAGDGETPGDERCDVTRPAVLDRQAGEIDVGAFPHDVLTRCVPDFLRRHVEHLFQHRPFLPGVAQAFRRLRFLQVGEQLADFAQACGIFLAHAQRHAFDRAEQVRQHRNGIPFGFFEQQRRAAGAQHAVGDLRHLQPGVDLDRDALQGAARFELGDEVAQVAVDHGFSRDIRTG